MGNFPDLPAYDTRPTNPLYGPLSLWLTGQNPFDPQDRPGTMAALAEVLGVEPKRLHQVRSSKAFRKFHSDHTSALDEIVIRRKEMIQRLYELGMEGSVTAMNAYLAHTKLADHLAEQGRKALDGVDIEDAANLTDEELAEFLGNPN